MKYLGVNVDYDIISSIGHLLTGLIQGGSSAMRMNEAVSLPNRAVLSVKVKDHVFISAAA